MIAICKILLDGRGRRLRKGLGLATALALAAAGVSLAEVTEGSEPLQAAMVPADAMPGTATPTAIEPGDAQGTAAADAASSRSEQQRRVFMLLLLNSAGPLRPYSGLSR